MKRKGVWALRRYLVEIKLGIFFLVAMVLLFITLLSIREVSFFKGTFPLEVTFNFAEGLKSASPVRFCGVDIGEVTHLEVKKVQGSPLVYVHTKIAKGTKIPSHSRFFINNLSLFGEKYLEILPPDEPSKTYINEGTVIAGIDSAPLFDVMASVQETANKLGNFINEGNLQGSLQQTIENIGAAAGELEGLLVDIKRKEGTVGRLFYDDSLYIKTEEFVEDLKQNPWKLLYKPKKRRK